MGGVKKPKTGIGAIDNAGDNIKNAVGQAGKDISNAAQSVGSGVETLVQDAGKNVETNYQNAAKNLANIASGDFSNLGQTVFNTGLSLTGVLNPDDIRRTSGQTSVERKTEEVIRQAQIDSANSAAADAATALETSLDGIRSTITGQIGARRMSPGRNMTLLSGGGGVSGTNTLLTIAKG